MGTDLPMDVDGVTAEWLSTALDTEVEKITVDRIVWGTATKVLVEVGYRSDDHGLPTRLCVKGGFREELRPMMARGYQTEARFFRDVAPRLGGLPHCYFAGIDADGGQGVIVLRDLVADGGSFADARVPLNRDLVAAGLEVIAGWHAHQDVSEPWLAEPPNIRDLSAMVMHPANVESCLAGEHSDLIREVFRDPSRLERGFAAVWAADDAVPKVLTHGDSNLTNVYLDPAGRISFVDWQFAALNNWAQDVELFLVGALSVEDRRAHEQDLLRHYLDAVAALGGNAPGWDEAWHAYCIHHLHGATYALTPEEMQPADVRAANADRYAAAALDHRTLDLLDPRA